jgi:hypothetical protein
MELLGALSRVIGYGLREQSMGGGGVSGSLRGTRHKTVPRWREQPKQRHFQYERWLVDMRKSGRMEKVCIFRASVLLA